MRKIISTVAAIALVFTFAVPVFAQVSPVAVVKGLAKVNNLTLKGTFVSATQDGKSFTANMTKVSPKKASSFILKKEAGFQINKQTKVVCKTGATASISAFLVGDKLEVAAKVDAKGNLIAKKVRDVSFTCSTKATPNNNNSPSDYIAPLSPSEGFFGAVAKINQTAMTFDLNVNGGTYHVKATASTQIVMSGASGAKLSSIKNGDNVVIKGSYDEALNLITAERIDVSANVPLQ